jgi:hypothetical protein
LQYNKVANSRKKRDLLMKIIELEPYLSPIEDEVSEILLKTSSKTKPYILL